MAFSTFTVLGNQHVCLVPRHLHHPKENPYLLTGQSFPKLLLLSPWKTRLPSSIDLPVLDVSYKWHHTMCGLLHLASFSQDHVFKVHPCCGTSPVYRALLELNNFPWHGHDTLSVFIHQLAAIWGISTFWVLWLCCYKHLVLLILLTLKFCPHLGFNFTPFKVENRTPCSAFYPSGVYW